MPGPEALYNRYKIDTDGLCGNMYVSVLYFFSYILKDTWSCAICGFWGLFETEKLRRYFNSSPVPRSFLSVLIFWIELQTC